MLLSDFSSPYPGHAESFNTPEGIDLVEELEEEGKIVFVFIDEVHKSLYNHWGGQFRRDMLTIPATIRAQTVDPTNIPVLAMSATLTLEERKEVEKELCIDSKSVVFISACPIQPNMKLMNIVRNNKFGDEIDDVVTEEGDLQLLKKIFLAKFEQCIHDNDFSNFKKTMVFVKNLNDAISINNYLCTKYSFIPVESRPWVINHSKKQSVSSHDISVRSDEGSIQLYLTTNTMLMGLNIPQIRIVVMLGPLSMLADLLQALGRASRREEEGRARCVLYTLYNNRDLVHHVSPCVVDFCKSVSCLKKFCNNHFGWPDAPSGGDWCCSVCNGV